MVRSAADLAVQDRTYVTEGVMRDAIVTENNLRISSFLASTLVARYYKISVRLQRRVKKNEISEAYPYSYHVHTT